MKRVQHSHGMSGTRFYVIYCDILTRVNNPNHPRFKTWGGRGIKCLWSNFLEFRDDMYESYLEHSREHGEKNTTIDRIDNDGNYEFENCMWSTQKKQANNRNNNRFVTFRDKTQTIPQWARELNVNSAMLYHRIFISNWTVEDAFTKKSERSK